jgi:hypothetical protein
MPDGIIVCCSGLAAPIPAHAAHCALQAATGMPLLQSMGLPDARLQADSSTVSGSCCWQPRPSISLRELFVSSVQRLLTHAARTHAGALKLPALTQLGSPLTKSGGPLPAARRAVWHARVCVQHWGASGGGFIPVRYSCGRLLGWLNAGTPAALAAAV